MSGHPPSGSSGWLCGFRCCFWADGFSDNAVCADFPCSPLCVCSPAACFHLDVGLSLPVGLSNTRASLPSSRARLPAPVSRAWFGVFSQLGSFPSPPPHPPVCRCLVRRCRRWAPVPCSIPLLLPPWVRSLTPDDEIKRRLSQPVFLPKRLPRLLHPTHHCQINRAEVLLKKATLPLCLDSCLTIRSNRNSGLQVTARHSLPGL